MPPRADKGRVTEELSRLRQELNVWRNSPKKGRRIPQPIWEQATELAARHGVSVVSNALRMDYAKLKLKVSARQGALQPSQTQLPQFVELFGAPAPSAMLDPCVLHIESHRGSRVRVEVGGLDAGGLALVLREFA